MISVVAVGASGEGPNDRITTLRRQLMQIVLARFGPQPPDFEKRIGQITDLTVLKKLLVRVLTISRLDEVFAEE